VSAGAETTAGQAELKARGLRPYPVPDETTARYWEAAARHRLVLPRCQACGAFRHPAETACPDCGATAADWTQVTGTGVIETYMVDHRNLVPGFDAPYAVAVVVLDGTRGRVRLIANVRGCPLSEITMGMSVGVEFEQVAAGVVLPQFAPREDDAA